MQARTQAREPVPVTLNGTTYVLSEFTVAVWQALEKQVVANRPNQLDEAKTIPKDWPEDLRRKLYEECWNAHQKRHRVSFEEITEYATSMAGAVFTGWQMALAKHPGLTLQRFTADVDAHGLGEAVNLLTDAINRANSDPAEGDDPNAPSPANPALPNGK